MNNLFPCFDRQLSLSQNAMNIHHVFIESQYYHEIIFAVITIILSISIVVVLRYFKLLPIVCQYICLLKLHAWLNFLKNASQVKDLPIQCVIICVFNIWAWPNYFKQFSQLKDISSVCLSICCLKLLARINFYIQVSYV